MTTNPIDTRALSGLRVLDFTIMLAGPYGARLMADLGAEVIKIEPPEGDDMRQRQPLRQAPDGQRHSAYFGSLNAGKRSLVLDLKKPAAVAIVKRLAASADVVIENYRPGVLDRLGIGAATLREINPRLIYCAISGYGQTGPGAGRAAYAMMVQAASGHEHTLMRNAGDRERPAATATFVADVLGGIYAFGAIQAALVQRARTGQGQVIDVALMDSMVNSLVYEMQEAQFPSGYVRPAYGPVSASDGDLILAPISERNFMALRQATGLAELHQDPRFATLGTRAVNWAAMMQVVQQWSRTRSVDQCLRELEAAGVPCARYAEPGANFDDEQLLHRGLFRPVADGAGSFMGVNAPWQMSGTASQVGVKVAGLGEHSEAVLEQVLGLSTRELAELRASGAFGPGRPASR